MRPSECPGARCSSPDALRRQATGGAGTESRDLIDAIERHLDAQAEQQPEGEKLRAHIETMAAGPPAFGFASSRFGVLVVSFRVVWRLLLRTEQHRDAAAAGAVRGHQMLCAHEGLPASLSEEAPMRAISAGRIHGTSGRP
jgi:hypothetical protein